MKNKKMELHEILSELKECDEAIKMLKPKTNHQALMVYRENSIKSFGINLNHTSTIV